MWVSLSIELIRTIVDVNLMGERERGRQGDGHGDRLIPARRDRVTTKLDEHNGSQAIVDAYIFQFSQNI